MARRDDYFATRFPNGLRDRLKVQAVLNRRSMNAEVVLAVEHWLARGESPSSGRTSSSPAEAMALKSDRSLE